MQFQHAEPLAPGVLQDDGSPRCAVCKRATGSTYYHAERSVVCGGCAEGIRTGEQAPPASSLAEAAFYGVGAAIAGCMLYAGVAIIFKIQISLIAILVGYMVGTGVRHGSDGRGGLSQQILAVVLTYFAITTSYLVVVIYRTGSILPLSTIVSIAAIAPFLRFQSNGLSGLIGLVIIFIGLQRAWRMTARVRIRISGPYGS